MLDEAIQCKKAIIPSHRDGVFALRNMKYTFVRDGKPEEVKPERWVWGVVYGDNTELHQFGDDGVFHQIKEIRMKEVKMFTMYKFDDMKKRIDLVITPEMQIVHFYRNIRPAGEDHFIKVYVFGYAVEDRESGMLAKTFNFILPDDRIIISNRDNIDLTKFGLRN